MSKARTPTDDPIVDSILRSPSLRREDNATLARLVAAGGPDGAVARNRMVEGNMRLVLTMARRYPDGTLTLHDRLQEGTIGLMRAVSKFDPSRGFSFATYAIYWIKACIDRAVYNNDHAVTIPANVSHAIRRLRRIEATSSTPITDEEFVRALNLGPTVVAAIRQLPTSQIPFDAPIHHADSEGVTYAEIIADPMVEDPEASAVGVSLWRALETCPNMTDRERSMLGLFVLGETYQDVSAVYGLSRERVRQIVAAAMVKIARHMGAPNGVAVSRRRGG